MMMMLMMMVKRWRIGRTSEEQTSVQIMYAVKELFWYMRFQSNMYYLTDVHQTRLIYIIQENNNK